MIHPRPRALCAICADRPATTITDWECESGATRTIVACFPCLSPVPDPPEEYEPADLAERVSTRPALTKRDGTDHTLRDAILAAVGQRGEVTSKELQAAFTMVDAAERCALTKSLSRLVERGLLVAAWVDENDHLLGRRFRAAAEDPIVTALAKMPDEFTSRDVDLNAQVASGVVRRWKAAGLIEIACAKREKKRGGTTVQVSVVWRKTARAIARAA